VDTTEAYLAVAVTLLFMAGIGLLVVTVRQGTRTRKAWGWRVNGMCARTSMAGRFDFFPIGKERNEDLMLTTFMKWIASAALLGGLVLLAFPGVYARGYQAGLLILIPAAATVVIFQAAFLGEYRWVAAFGVVAFLFNPVVPLGFSAAPSLVVNTLALILFGLSLKLLKTPPRLSIASITDCMPGSESL
jgi:hypothetical protein